MKTKILTIALFILSFCKSRAAPDSADFLSCLNLQISEKKSGSSLVYPQNKAVKLKLDTLIFLRDAIQHNKFQVSQIDSPVDVEFEIEEKYRKISNIKMVGMLVSKDILLIRIYYADRLRSTDIHTSNQLLMSKFLDIEKDIK